jgi:hypothetical protein
MQIRDLERIFVYHAPQYPGFTSWVGLWNMPDDSVMCSFIQATGPLDGRPKAPKTVRQYLTWPPVGHGDEYDMTGLDLRHVHLRSTDCGRSWTQVSAPPFTSCMNGAPGEAEEVYPDSRAAFGGVILRGIWGPYLPYDDDVPRNGFLQRSNDGARTWGPPELFYEAENTMFWAKRLRPLRDGRWLAGGGLFFIHPEYDNRRDWFRDMTMALFVGDAEARNWTGPISIIPDDQRGEFAGEEFDWAELEDGDLLCVLRTETLPTVDARDAGQQRRITRLTRSGESWKPTRVEMAPFPHSGHPDVLRTREGLVLHLATSAISASADDGQSWIHFDLAPATAWQGWCGPGTPYYPKAVQLPNGEILVLGHVGGDNGYGTIDQAIVGMRFRLDP